MLVKGEQQYQENEVDHKHRDEVLLNVIRPEYERPAPPPPMEPLYPLTDGGKVQGSDVLLVVLHSGYLKTNTLCSQVNLLSVYLF